MVEYIEVPVQILRGIKNLTPNELDKQLKDEEDKIYYQNDWNEECKRKGLFIDLSQLRWVNLSAAAQLTLLIENAVKSSVKVYIALPIKRNTAKETLSQNINLETKTLLREKRTEANNFLKNIGFIDAAKCKHIKSKTKVEISEDYEFVDKQEEISLNIFQETFNKSKLTSHEFVFRKYNYKYIYPLTWINCKSDSNNFTTLEENLERILLNDDRGLNNIDVLSIKNVIISELIKNVREHAGLKTNYALLAVGLFNSKSLYSVNKNEIVKVSNSIENDYVRWLIETSIENQVEIYFGDSGNGLITQNFRNAYKKNINQKKLNDENLLEWAFDKWSTSKSEETLRGTKGLYRINRISNKYNGIFHIRTNNIDGGFQKGGYSSAKWLKFSDQLFHFPGTFVQIKLCPFAEVVKFNLNFENNRRSRDWKSLKFIFINDNGADFKKLLEKEIQSDENILLIIEAKNALDKVYQKFLEDHLKLLSQIRHPNGIVVYIANDLGSISIENIVNSVNELILKEINDSSFQEVFNLKSEEVYDPVLVLERSQNLFWFGGSQIIVTLLNEAIKEENIQKKITDLKSYVELDEHSKNLVKLHFQNDDSTVTLSKEDKLEFDFTNISELFERKVKTIFIGIKDQKEKNICTPRLEPVSEWHDVSKLLKPNEVGFSISLYFNILNYYKNLTKEFDLNENKTFILIDHNQQRGLAVEFARIIGISTRNVISAIDDIDNNLPRRTKLFSSGDEVIILTTIISTSETIRRLVKYIRRDLASPLFILCLANFRKNNITQLHNWEEYTPIISLYQHYINEDLGEKSESSLNYFESKLKVLFNIKQYVSPRYNVVKQLEQYNLKNQISLPLELKNHIIKTKSLHYNHIGKFNDRHFTFYIDKEKILKTKSIIWQKVEEEINTWINHNRISKFSIFIPQVSNGQEESFKNFYFYLKNKFKNVTIQYFENDLLINESNVVYIDFGSLTGNSINKFISSIIKTDNLLMCIIFDQFNNNELNFYKKLKILRNTENVYPSMQLGKGDIFFKEDTNIILTEIFKFPLRFFTSENCPICEHNRALDYYKINQEYLLKFSIDRQYRLKIRNKDEIAQLPFPCDFYFSEDDYNHELSSELIMKMYELKLLFESAGASTQFRIVLFDYVFQIYKNLEVNLEDCESNLYAFLYLLSNEVNWIQKEPLVFRDFRRMIAYISVRVATIPIVALTEKFNLTNKTKVSPLKLAIRYKYSAITVLRSSNKLNFCKEISKMLISSVYENKLSNNLSQNVFYHIISLYKNDYNTSKEYYKAISHEINVISTESINIPLTVTQKLALHKINVLNQRSLKKLDLINLDSDKNIINNLIDS